VAEVELPPPHAVRIKASPTRDRVVRNLFTSTSLAMKRPRRHTAARRGPTARLSTLLAIISAMTS